MGNPRCDPLRRHYKKDTRFLLDLYTLTYDEGESVTSRDVQVQKLVTTCRLFLAYFGQCAIG